jgi:hypothetical protein
MKALIFLFILSIHFSALKAQNDEGCITASNDITACVNEYLNQFSAITNTAQFCNLFYEYISCLTIAIANCPGALQYWIPEAKAIIQDVSNECGYFIVPPNVPLRRILGYGDPHYIRYDGTHIICDQVGTFTLVAFAFGMIQVEQINLDGGVIISEVTLYSLYPTNVASVTLDQFNYTQSFDFSEPGVVFQGADGVINFFNYFNLTLSYNFGFSIYGYFPEAVAGILVTGCNYTAVNYTAFAESVCENLTGFAQTSCLYDVSLTNNTFYYDAALGAQTYYNSTAPSYYVNSPSPSPSHSSSSILQISSSIFFFAFLFFVKDFILA